MVFETASLNQPLNSYIESMFHYKGFMPDHSIERVVPTGHLFILFELDDIPRQTFDNESLKPLATFTKAWISGMHKNHLSISAHQDSEMFVIQFKPFGSYPFLQLPIEQLNNQVLPAEEVFGAEILKLREQLFAKTESAGKFLIAEEWLKGKFDDTKTPGSALLSVFSELINHPISAHQKIIENYPNTQKHLINQFKKYAGLTPKVFHRILRFNELLQQIRDQEKISWGQIADQCGYTDQSHFIKEFKQFSGFNPQEFIKRSFNKDEPNFFPLDREG